MRELNEHHSFIGMQTDIAPLKTQPNFLYSARNVRVTSRGDSTMLAITNERGAVNKSMTVFGKYLGHCVIGKYLVVFSIDDNTSCISRYDLSTDSLSRKVVYFGPLNFSKPITAIPFYESETIQKVYWIDGVNQPRFVNVVGDYKRGSEYSTQFDFIQELQLEEEVCIEKQVGTSGYFPSGVIQYCFTYYNKYGQESNIFYTSPLFYISPADRGGRPDESVSNSFKITINKVDRNFKYVRIYSILRTSLDGTPITKRVADIKTDSSITYTDTGMIGDNIDPSELLYKGGQSIIPAAIAQKDGTLFLGNIKLNRQNINESIKDRLKGAISIDETIAGVHYVKENGHWSNQLYGHRSDSQHIGHSCAGFKSGEYYRLGVQFQYKDGSWTDPIYRGDHMVNRRPLILVDTSYVNIIQGTIDSGLTQELKDLGYKKARAVCCFPSELNRHIVCQGVACVTTYQRSKRSSNVLYAQSSWFFRHKNVANYLYPYSGFCPTTSIWGYYDNNPTTIERELEIGAFLDEDNVFTCDSSFYTVHSPDVEFDDSFNYIDFNNTETYTIGNVTPLVTMSDINIQTSSGVAKADAAGFIGKAQTLETNSISKGIGSGYFYEDYIMDDASDGSWVRPYKDFDAPCKWFVYVWQKEGSLNNDYDRPASLGLQTSKLKKKVISNLRCYRTYYSESAPSELMKNSKSSSDIALFNSDQVTIVKSGNKVYQGNVDTVIVPDKGTGKFFIYKEKIHKTTNASDSDVSDNKIKVWNDNINKWENISDADDVGDSIVALTRDKNPIKMRYKSTPHLVVSGFFSSSTASCSMDIVEIFRKNEASDIFGDNSTESLKLNTWLPCGEPVLLGNNEDGSTLYKYSYGDSYCQRWDCLKTYPFSPEDTNQIVEIGSFVLESRINVAGRYDRNKGQVSNLNMTPQNFNLLNKVYSQKDNFFVYRILDDDYYNLDSFPNQVTWTKEKQPGADIDAWTNITMTNTYNMDGTSGKINSINLFKDQLFCFQDTAISTILFNSRVQIPTSDGVPIEISNNYKVDGHRTLSNGIGCSSADLIKVTPNSLYFIDSIANHLYQIGEGLVDLSSKNAVTSLFKDREINRLLYDNINHDLYIVNNEESLCYSELLNQFTSFFDYPDINLIEVYNGKVFTLYQEYFFEMFAGEYNNLLPVPNEREEIVNDYRPWYISFICNGSNNSTQDLDKIFTNIDYRMDLSENEEHKCDLSFDFIRVQNEYQDTQETLLQRLKVLDNSKSYHHKDTNLQKKFRIWRIQIPRSKKWHEYSEEELEKKRSENPQFDETGEYILTMDRIRNTWCKITLKSNGSTNSKAVLHDINVQYYI